MRNNYVIYLLFILLIIFTITVCKYKYRKYQLPKVKISEIKDQLKTGDLVICSASINQISSKNLEHISALRCFTSSIYKMLYYTIFDTCWSHAGIIIRMNDKVYLYENTFNDLPKICHFWGKYISKGSRLILLDDKVDDYTGFVAIRPINKEIPINRVNIRKTPFNIDIYKYIHDLLFKRKIDESYDPTTQMCSEMTLNFLKKAKIIESDANPKIFMPHHFFSDKYRYINGYQHYEPFIVEK